MLLYVKKEEMTEIQNSRYDSKTISNTTVPDRKIRKRLLSNLLLHSIQLILHSLQLLLLLVEFALLSSKRSILREGVTEKQTC